MATPFRVKCLLERVSKLRSARNCGFAASREGLIMFNDDDYFAEPDWIKIAALTIKFVRAQAMQNTVG